MLRRLAGPVALPVGGSPIVSAGRATPHRGPSRGQCPGTRAGDWPGHRHLRDANLVTRDARHIFLAPIFHHQRRYHAWSAALRRPYARVSTTHPIIGFLLLPLMER